MFPKWNFDVVINVKDADYINSIGSQLRDLRISRGLSQQKLANLAEIERSQVSRIERGAINPTVSSVNRIAKILGVSLLLV